jgi:hypothetical protein
MLNKKLGPASRCWLDRIAASAALLCGGSFIMDVVASGAKQSNPWLGGGFLDRHGGQSRLAMTIQAVIPEPAKPVSGILAN